MIAAALGLTLWSATAEALNGNELHAKCEADEDLNRMLCIGYIIGAAEMFAGMLEVHPQADPMCIYSSDGVNYGSLSTW